jgi:hypothetical protein
MRTIADVLAEAMRRGDIVTLQVVRTGVSPPLA